MFLIISTCIFAYLLYLFMKRKINMRKNYKDFDGPKGWPLIGNVLEFKNRDVALANSTFYAKEYKGTFIAFLGFIPIIFIADPIFLEELLSSNVIIDKSVDYSFFKRWWGDGLLTSTGAKWKKRRKILTPAFHYQILEDFVATFEKRGKCLIDNLNKTTNHDSFDIFKVLTLYTLDVICETAMGTTVDAQTNPDDIYIKSVKEMCDIANKRSVSILYRSDFIYELSPLYKYELKVVKALTDFSTKIIRERRHDMNKNKELFSELDEFGRKAKCTFLDILLQSTVDGEPLSDEDIREEVDTFLFELQSTVDGEPLSDEDIREEVDTFLFEGHDTTGIALSYIAYSLAQNPKIQAKAYEEIIGIFGDDKNTEATMDNLQNLKYLEMVIKEALRLYPSVPFHTRVPKQDIKIGGKFLPKGVTLLINQWALHRNENYFPDPEKFDPERFDPNLQTKRHPYAYIPFSAGPRNCIGQKFAMLELKSCIAKILRNFVISEAIPAFKPQPVAVATLLSTNGVNVRLRKRL